MKLKCNKCNGTGLMYKRGRPKNNLEKDVIYLREKGWTYEAIAKKLDTSVGYAHSVIKNKFKPEPTKEGES